MPPLLTRVAAGFTVVTLLLFASVTVQAQIKPGEYVSGGGFGVLRITPDKGGAMRFLLNVRGANFHICELSGVIQKGESRMEDSADDKLPCIVTFKPEKNGVDVGSKHERTCSTYCGARAHFEASYSLPPEGCAPTLVRRTRNQFKAAYDKKLFAEARALLAPVSGKCSGWLTELDNAWIDNDLALTQYRNGDSIACRNTLKPWLELAQTPDETINGDYPPSDAAEMLRIAQATRANMKICGAPVAIGGKGSKGRR
ncbi:MAG: hypothetical protein ABL891_15235 [Burkholderiales bacterium]